MKQELNARISRKIQDSFQIKLLSGMNSDEKRNSKVIEHKSIERRDSVIVRGQLFVLDEKTGKIVKQENDQNNKKQKLKRVEDEYFFHSSFYEQLKKSKR